MTQITDVVGPNDLYFDSNAVTVLQSASGADCTKTFMRDATGTEITKDITMSYLWKPKAILAPTIERLFDIIKALSDSRNRCVIRGALRNEIQSEFVVRRMKDDIPRGLVATFTDVPRTWVALDIDSFMGTLKDFYGVLFSKLPFFEGVSHIVQRSSSFGKYPGELRVRLWFRSSAPATGGYWKHLFSDIPEFANKVDLSLFAPIQIHFTAAPIFLDGIEDPCAERVTLHQDLLDELDISRVPPELRLRASSMQSKGDISEPPVIADKQQLANALEKVSRQIAKNSSGHNHAGGIAGELYLIGCSMEQALPIMEAAITRAHGRTPGVNEAAGLWNDMVAKARSGGLTTTNPPVDKVFSVDIEAPLPPAEAARVAEDNTTMLNADVEGEWTSDAHANAGRYERMYFRGFVHWNGCDFELLKNGCWKLLETETTLELRMSRDTRLSRGKVTAAAFAIRAQRLHEALNPPCSLSTGAPISKLIMFRNGYMKRDEVVAGQRKLYPHNADNFALATLEVNYNPAAKCPRFDQFMAEVFPGDEAAQTVILRIMAYILTADISFQKFFMLVGPPASGKTTLTKVIDSILGRDNVASISSMESLTDPFGLQPLLGKLLAYFPEANQIGGTSKIGRSVTNIIKLITGMDRVTVNRKNSPQLCVQLPVRLIATCNTPPELGDDSGALGRRLVVVTFPVSFADRMDVKLDDTLIAEKEGIINKLLDAFAGLYGSTADAGFHTPDSARETLESVLMDASPVSAFLAECTARDVTGSVTMDELSEISALWCAANRTYQISGISMGRALLRLPGVTKSKSNSVARRYFGLTLSPAGVRLKSGAFG